MLVGWTFFVCFVLSFETESHHVASLGWPETLYVIQAGSELEVILLLTPKSWDYRHMPLHQPPPPTPLYCHDSLRHLDSSFRGVLKVGLQYKRN